MHEVSIKLFKICDYYVGVGDDDDDDDDDDKEPDTKKAKHTDRSPWGKEPDSGTIT